YDVLGVPKDARIDEIRVAHRELVLKCHPDKLQDQSSKVLKQKEFDEIQKAYEILSDPVRRAEFD
ncbi:heat shock protein DnaJ, partial [Mollisia scopiformis]